MQFPKRHNAHWDASLNKPYSLNSQPLRVDLQYNYDWYKVSFPEPFYFKGDVRLSLIEENDNEGNVINRDNSIVNQTYFPDIIMHADGYIEPDTNLSLAFENYASMFIYRQEGNGFNLTIRRTL